MRGIAHDRDVCNEEPRGRRLITCRKCKRTDLVWHVCSCGTTHSRWPALYERMAGVPTVMADTSKPHVCDHSWRNIPQPEQPQPAPAPTAGVDPEKFEEAVKHVVETVSREMERRTERAAEEFGRMLQEFRDELDIPLKPTIIELRREGEDTVKIEGAHRQVPELLYWCNARDLHGYRFSVMLFGKPGVSKSYSARQVADSLGLSYGLISLNPQTPESRLFGFRDAGGTYHRTLFREAFECGGMFLIDEIDNASDALLTSLNSCLANSHGAFPDGLVKRHPDFVCVATANTPGRGGDMNHAGRRQLDAATINRFATIEWTNDDDLEARLVQGINPRGTLWLDWVRKVRGYCAQHHPRVVVSPRSSMMGAKALLDSPFKIETIADMTLFKGLDRDTKFKILAACPLPEVE